MPEKVNVVSLPARPGATGNSAGAGGATLWGAPARPASRQAMPGEDDQEKSPGAPAPPQQPVALPAGEVGSAQTGVLAQRRQRSTARPTARAGPMTGHFNADIRIDADMAFKISANEDAADATTIPQNRAG